MLSTEQIEFFKANGFLVVEDAVSADQLRRLRDDFANWVEDSRIHDEAWGEIINGKPRFDVEQGHSAATPALRQSMRRMRFQMLILTPWRIAR